MHSAIDDDVEQQGSKRKELSGTEIIVNFTVMAVLFSLNHGCVTACVALASSDLGADLGAWSSGTLYLMYTICALVGANVIVHFTGVKYGLVSALLLYCTYIASFLVARNADGNLKWFAALAGSTIGGFAAGYLWTAQGPFMQAAAKLYSRHIEASDESGNAALLPSEKGAIALKKSNSLLAGIFGFLYLVCEALMKAAATFLPTKFDGGETMIYIVYTIISVCASVGMIFVVDLTKHVDSGKAAVAARRDVSLQTLVLGKAGAAVELLTTDPKMVLLYPMQMGFGIASSFVGYYANAELVSNCVNTSSTNYIGYFAALIAVVAGLCSPVFSFVTRRVLGGRKMPVMILGIVAFLVEMTVYMAYDLRTDELVRGEKLCGVGPLLTLYVLHGIGRGVWESTNKAVILDFFPDNPAAAFANVIVSSGLASTIGFFMYQFNKDLVNHPLVVTTLTVVLCALALVTYPLAVFLQEARK